MSAALLDLEAAIAHAQEHAQFAPEEGWRSHEGRTERWRGWRVYTVDLRGRRQRRVSFVIYGDALTREGLDQAVALWFRQAGR